MKMGRKFISTAIFATESVQERGHKIASYYRENISGTKLDRPELERLLMDSHRNDILLVEQIDRLTRLSNSDWMTLKRQIEQHELRIVSLDIPTSCQALSDKDPAQSDPITRAVITAINNMLMDLMATMSNKDRLSRRQRQKQGIERAHTWVNTGENRRIRNGTRKFCTTGRSRN
ncbi:DNA invertase Pin-like site-specific DNA recombinase [Yokenella regensburgei]|nr:DNA invertase Pin-like site-specific DNA recombinase [Yokenella regensburgei]